MLKTPCARLPGRPQMRQATQRGSALIEVLVSILIVSFGLMALAGLQTTMNSALLESYQRSQALTLLQDMAQRVESNQTNAANYVTLDALGVGFSLGTGDAQPTTCTTTSIPGATRAQLDQCEWSRLLKGASETSAGGSSVGTMLGGRGCIQLVQAADSASGVCQPGIYRITVAWQGMNATVAPGAGQSCGEGQYVADTLRKVVSNQVLIPLPGCS